MAGRRNSKDPRNSLFMEFVRFVKEIKPRYFVMENVPGILTMKIEKGYLVKNIIEHEFKKIGYSVISKKLNAADYGVPQKRKRVFFIGTNNDKQISFPDRTYTAKWISVNSVLLPKNQVSEEFFHSERMIAGFKKRKKFHEMKGNGFGAQYLKLNEPSYTISARYWKDGSDALVKYNEREIRMLTPKECAAIQTFPEDYKFAGSKREVYTQIGNAVPCLLAKSVAEEIKKLLQKNSEIKETIILQNYQ